MVGRITEKIDNILPVHPSTNIHICGDFNIHYNEWPVHSKRTKEEGKYYYDFSIAYVLTQNIDKPIRVPDTAGLHVNLLDLFLTSFSDQCPTEVLSCLNNPGQKFPQMYRFIGQSINIRKLTGTASNPTFPKADFPGRAFSFPSQFSPDLNASSITTIVRKSQTPTLVHA